MTNAPPPPPGSPPPPPGPPPGAPPPPPGFGAPPPGMPTGGVRYAGWWQRVGAAFLDGLIAIPFYIPAFIAVNAGPTEIVFKSDGPQGPGLYEQPTGGTVAVALLIGIAGFVAYLVIFSRMLGRGATPGKRAAGYRVLDEQTMQPIGTGRAVGRIFAVYLSMLPCYLGLLWPLWDKENRTFHDMIVRTRAIRD